MSFAAVRELEALRLTPITKSKCGQSNKTVSNRLTKNRCYQEFVLRQKTVNAQKNVPKSGKINIQEPKKKVLTDCTYWETTRVPPAAEPLS